jgi:hypothetical protein
MKKLFLLLTTLTTLVFSAIDECKTDVYFGTLESGNKPQTKP